ncbi:MAG: FAD-dependent oxidoreductase [Rhodobacteraceae bacterium]|jgi:oxygen-dependent protoporphyrinogen oxidase|nr:FAD-dependent oxidoreductase [Paracoccaceae bacterium]
MEPVHIIGAGIAGLGAAHYLAARGIPSVIHEASDLHGGRAATVLHEGHAFEVGGKNFSSAWPRFNALLREFGIAEFEPQHPGFHIVLHDRLVALEKSKTLKGDLRLASALGFRAAVQLNRFLAEARSKADALNYTSGLIEQVERDWDHMPIDGHFSRSLVDGPLRLFTVIMGAAEPSELYPSLLMLFCSGFGKGQHFAIRGGTGRLHDALADGKAIRYGSRVSRIVVERGRVTGLEMGQGRATKVLPARHVIAAVPLHVLLRLVELPAYARVAAETVRYRPLALINAVYDRPVFAEGVHSIMFEPGSILGHCSANRLHRPDHVRFTLSGRAAREVLHLPDDELIAAAEAAFAKRMPFEARRLTAHVARHPGGICGYAPYFSRVKRDLLRGVGTIAGLEVAGDYLEGHTMEGCLTSADLAVDRLFGREDLRQPA